MDPFVFLCYIITFQIDQIISKVNSLQAENIIGGEPAAEGQFKHQVSVETSDKYTCGGSIIADLFVITAAHCVIDRETGKFRNKLLMVVAALTKIFEPEAWSIKIEVIKIFVPRNYNPMDKYLYIPCNRIGDLAVLMLKHELGLGHNSNLTKLRLPEKSAPYLNVRLFLTGYGFDQIRVENMPGSIWGQEYGSTDGKLRFAEAAGVPRADCCKVIQHSITDSNVCIRLVQHNEAEPRGACTGDSGGAAFTEDNVIIGILIGTSRGCVEHTFPGIYTQVSSHVDFVQHVLEGRKFSGIRSATWTKVSDNTYVFVED